MVVAASITVSIGFLVALPVCQPYRSKSDQTMAAGCQIVFVCLFLGGMIVLQYDMIDAHPSVPSGLASELLSRRYSARVTQHELLSTPPLGTYRGCPRLSCIRGMPHERRP
eukprot:2709298-Prymnesium_polylepis.1